MGYDYSDGYPDYGIETGPDYLRRIHKDIPNRLVAARLFLYFYAERSVTAHEGVTIEDISKHISLDVKWIRYYLDQFADLQMIFMNEERRYVATPKLLDDNFLCDECIKSLKSYCKNM